MGDAPSLVNDHPCRTPSYACSTDVEGLLPQSVQKLRFFVAERDERSQRRREEVPVTLCATCMHAASGARRVEHCGLSGITGAMDPTPASAVAHIIQLSVAPVFLLAGIGSILNVLTARLSRVVDRARSIEASIATYDPEARERALILLKVLDRRMATAHWAISCCTSSALFVCLVVALLFTADLIGASYSRTVALLFILAMALIVAGLLLFLTEIRLATKSVRVRRDLLLERAQR